MIFSTSVWGQWIHWYGRRSHECTSDKGQCNGCQRGWPKKWKGYLHVYRGNKYETAFLEITPFFVQMLDVQVPPPATLRGVQMYVSKTRGGAKGRFIIDVMERRLQEAELRVECDPRPVLQFLWNCKNTSSNQEPETL